MSKKYRVEFVLRIILFLILALALLAVATMTFGVNAASGDFDGRDFAASAGDFDMSEFDMFEDETPLITNEQSEEGVAIEIAEPEFSEKEPSATGLNEAW